MNQKETTYVEKFRHLAGQQDRIKTSIGNFQTICGSLKNWQDTAASLMQPGGLSKIWSIEQLQELMTLRGMLMEYEQSRKSVEDSWLHMNESERIGLSPPSALAEKSVG